jgi:hypothetical protein
MRGGSSPIAGRFSLCANFRLRTHGSQNIPVYLYCFAAAISRSSPRVFASTPDQPYN